MCYLDNSGGRKLTKMTRKMIDDETWSRLEPLLPKQKTGRPPKDNRNFIDSVYWILRTGSPWRDMPEIYGPWKSSYNRFNYWVKKGFITQILEFLKKI